MSKAVKKIWNWISGVLVGIVVLLAIALVGVRLIGLQPYMVLSGSMEPTYHVFYVKSVDYKNLKAGDPITYMIFQDTVVTHRIIEVLVDEEDPETIRYFTQGDANDVPDGTSVHYKNIIGKPVFSIPYLGYVSNYIQNPPGKYVAIAAGAILILLVFLPDVFPTRIKRKKPKKASFRQLVKKLPNNPCFLYNRGNGALLWKSGEKTYEKSQLSSISIHWFLRSIFLGRSRKLWTTSGCMSGWIHIITIIMAGREQTLSY